MTERCRALVYCETPDIANLRRSLVSALESIGVEVVLPGALPDDFHAAAAKLSSLMDDVHAVFVGVGMLADSRPNILLTLAQSVPLFIFVADEGLDFACEIVQSNDDKRSQEALRTRLLKGNPAPLRCRSSGDPFEWIKPIKGWPAHPQQTIRRTGGGARASEPQFSLVDFVAGACLMNPGASEAPIEGVGLKEAETTSMGGAVEFSVFGPSHPTVGGLWAMDLWIYKTEERTKIVELATECQRERRLGVKAGVRLTGEVRLSAHLDLPELIVTDPEDAVDWFGYPTNVSWIVEAPSSLEAGQYPGTVTVKTQGIPICKLRFVVEVVEATWRSHHPFSRPNAYAISAKQPRSAFASYASEDRQRVLARIQGMKSVCPDLDIFLDVLSLRSGDDWATRLEQEIVARDSFLLFWSKQAKNSEWVEKEWRLALAAKGLKGIEPVPLDGPREAVPPAELASLHFSDPLLAMVNWRGPTAEHTDV